MIKAALIMIAVLLFIRGVMWLLWKMVPGLRRTTGSGRGLRNNKKKRSNVLRPSGERVVPIQTKKKYI